MTVICGDGRRTWVDFETVRQPTRASFSQKPLYDFTRSKAVDDCLFIQPVSWHHSWRLAAAPTSRLPAVVLTEDHGTQKWVLQGPRARVLAPALSDQPGEKGQAQSAGKGHCSDEKIIPPFPRLGRWTSCSVKPFVSGDTARLGRKDMSGKLQNLLMFLPT